MADLFGLSEKIISEGVANEPVNRINHQLSELTNDIAMVEAFSHSIVFNTDDGLVVFDTSGAAGGQAVVDAIRGWSNDRFNTLVYTHGHIDHVGGSGAFARDAREASVPNPQVVGHKNVPVRFDRYDYTNGYNKVINSRQFGGFAGLSLGGTDSFLPRDTIRPTVVYNNRLKINIGGLEVELRHAKGETDDHTWSWLPKHKAICAGDFFIWNFPNAGNPQKVQRFPLEWAIAMREMADMGAELFLPAHGLPIRGAETIRMVLEDVASALETLILETLQMMNEGARLNDIVHSVSVNEEILAKPYLRPLYDEPEFVINNLWRLYGGWYDGNPANLKPAKDSALAAEVSNLAGGVNVLAGRARELAEAGDFRLSCHLAEMAVLAEPENKAAHAARAEVFEIRRKAETSLMAKGIYRYAAEESADKASD
jgi:alkyl sulfatase BDS1-like metallo-beta-lactamase superfamily hydrolase